MTEEEVFARYDFVIHMISAAMQDVRCYNRTSNEYRMENLKEAKELEKKGIEVWRQHPKFLTIGTFPTFEEKLEQLKEAVRVLLEI